MVCCKCNRAASCRNCACVKASKKCSNCLPSKLDSCSNILRSLPSPVVNTSACCNVPVTSSSTITSQPSAMPSVDYRAVTNVPESLQHDASNSCPPPKDSCPPVPTPPVTPMPILPAFKTAAGGNFTWGDSEPASFCQSLQDAYAEVVHWRMNLFTVPLGISGKSFVSELARLYEAFASCSALESIALMATIVLPILVLQKPHFKSKVKEHIACLERRLKCWKAGDIASLLSEGRILQQRLPKFSKKRQKNTWPDRSQI